MVVRAWGAGTNRAGGVRDVSYPVRLHTMPLDVRWMGNQSARAWLRSGPRSRGESALVLGLPSDGTPVTRGPGWGVGVIVVAALLCGSQELRAAPEEALPTQTGASAPQPTPGSADAVSVFRHVQHQAVQCLACHQMGTAHGASTIRTFEDCRSCHHSGPSVRECAACHVEVDIQGQVFTLNRTFTLSVDDVPSERQLPFSHGSHGGVQCVQCHAEGPSLAVPDLDCQSCHEEHHAVSATGCLGCHQEPASDVHELVVHATCAGSGCHEQVPVGSAPRNRTGCLWCHQDQAEHEPEGECVRCHLMPAPRGPEN